MYTLRLARLLIVSLIQSKRKPTTNSQWTLISNTYCITILLINSEYKPILIFDVIILLS